MLKRLRSEILDMEEGHYLGSGKDLSVRYAISRPTLHQVVRALEHEQLIAARRGPNGGYYVRRPNLNAAVAAVSTYLRSSGTQLRHFVTLARVVHAEACRLAARSTDVTGRSSLAAELASFWDTAQDVSPETLLKHDYRLEGILFDLADNPVVELFMRLMHHFWCEVVTEQLLEGHPDRTTIWISHRRRLCETVLAGEGGIAVAIGHSHWDYLTGWLEGAIGEDSADGDNAGARKPASLRVPA